MDELLKRKADKLLKNKGNEFLTQLEATMELADKLDSVVESIKSIPETVIPEYPEMPEPLEEVRVTNLPEVQKVEITNLPKEKDNNEELKLLKELVAEVKKKEEYAYDIEIDSALKEQLRGLDGLNGLDGKDGKDGTEITVEQIADKINSKKDIINISSIKGLIKTIESIKAPRVITTTPSVTPSNKTFVYNPNGTLLTYTNGRGTKTFTYNSSGLLTNVAGTGAYNNWTFTYNNGVLTNVNLS